MPKNNLRTFPSILLIATLASVMTALALVSLQPPSDKDSPESGLWRAAAAGPEEKGQAIFEQKCKSCHTIGGGKLVGPDLKGISARRDRDWLIKFTAAPDRLIAQGDPLAKQLVDQYRMPMPNTGVSEADAAAVLAYIDAQSGAVQGPPPKAPPVVQAVSVSAPASTDTSLGRALFTGQVALRNGGPSCLSCHNAGSVTALGGGTLAADLTNIYASLGDQGITAVLKTAPFPLMKDIYGSKPLTDEEIASLAAFLKETSQQSAAPAPFPIFIVIGAIGALFVIILFQLFWRGRLSAVRRPMVNGASK